MTSPQLHPENKSSFDFSAITSRPYAIFGVVIASLLVINQIYYSHVMSSSNLSSSSSSPSYDLSFTPLVEILNTRNPGEYSPWKQELYTRLDHMRSKCGVPCSINSIDDFYKFATRGYPGGTRGSSSTTTTTSSPGIITADKEPTGSNSEVRLEVPINCQQIFELKEIDAGDMTFPPAPPEELVPLYTLGGSIPVVPNEVLKSAYLNGNDKLIWTREDVETRKELLKKGELTGTYGIPETNKIRDFVLNKMSIYGKSVLVIGSERPWLEAAALLAGAAKVTTLEYAEIDSQHPQIDTYTPSAFRAAYMDGTLGTFDAILSHSSLEHSGLGRYGDALNPWGDILSLARAWCVTKEHGQMMLGLPTCSKDAVLWNIHRCYGPIRWPLITMNWVKTDGRDYSYEADGIGSAIGVLHAFKKVS
eukprot:CAMPEP_0203651184 /NCGR_PEP_ID=MMETSP0088-20131115/26672_1 /ASSEMBLY_ACC=CAM_ASM_001087 /TAXON_ID=426623 /ORGANISM="Chaetoceros affinis, Strain CCMP159" /LENGTH=418 /DNA_ID=CAMNT_0050510221 /DNA_START=98 /DNA_END=1354 /DNA_ORIENTATION=-